MYIEINGDKNSLVSELEKLKGQSIIFHYRCSDCGDEQVTYVHEVNAETIYLFANDRALMVRYDCTNCGKYTLYLYSSDIIGVETYTD